MALAAFFLAVYLTIAGAEHGAQIDTVMTGNLVGLAVLILVIQIFEICLYSGKIRRSVYLCVLAISFSAICFASRVVIIGGSTGAMREYIGVVELRRVPVGPSEFGWCVVQDGLILTIRSFDGRQYYHTWSGVWPFKLRGQMDSCGQMAAKITGNQ
ncbi:hypothetical protein TPR58_01295 [Sphingomonas sp. HF-S3]|uniref:Uncharacterized protein n=1 Tax=Sphingomonas rustica TaxID=3103142 RepID=A0ABV0B2G3_9SPHN